MEDKIYMTFHAINETGIEGTVMIEDGISLETASPFKGDRTKTNPEELFALAFSTCLGSSLRFVLEQANLKLKSRVDVYVDLMLNRDDKSYYFKVYAYGAIETLSIEEILPFLETAHARCSISKLTKNSEYISVLPKIY